MTLSVKHLSKDRVKNVMQIENDLTYSRLHYNAAIVEGNREKIEFLRNQILDLEAYLKEIKIFSEGR